MNQIKSKKKRKKEEENEYFMIVIFRRAKDYRGLPREAKVYDTQWPMCLEQSNFDTHIIIQIYKQTCVRQIREILWLWVIWAWLFARASVYERKKKRARDYPLSGLIRGQEVAFPILNINLGALVLNMHLFSPTNNDLKQNKITTTNLWIFLTFTFS